jgi:hypothetical protein
MLLRKKAIQRHIVHRLVKIPKAEIFTRSIANL